MDDGIYYDSIWAYEGDTYSPDFDMYLWDWDGYADPGDTLASFTTGADRELERALLVGRRSSTRVVDEANTTLDPRGAQGARLAGPADLLRAVAGDRRSTTRTSSRRSNTASWDGWTRMYGGTGAAFYTSYVRDSYLNLKPKAAAARRDGRRLDRDARDRPSSLRGRGVVAGAWCCGGRREVR